MPTDYELGMVELAGSRFDNIRKEFGSEEEQRRLGESLKKRQHHPIFRLANGLVYDGERRVRAALLVGMTELLAITSKRLLTPVEMVEIQFETAAFRADLTGFEKSQAVAAIQAAHPTWSAKELADHLRLDPKMIKILLSPTQVIAEVVDALRSNRIGISTCHEISLVDRSRQLAALELALSGASRDAVSQACRKLRTKPAAPAAKAAKFKFATPSGVVVSLHQSNKPLSIDDAIQELNEALTELRAAKRFNDTPKSFMERCNNRIKPGGGVLPVPSDPAPFEVADA